MRKFCTAALDLGKENKEIFSIPPIAIQSQENKEYITKSTIIVPLVESNFLKVS